MKAIEDFEKIRELVMKSIYGLSKKQLLEIPKKFSNNIWWNIGHLLVSQQQLQYKLSKIELNVTKEDVGKYRKGSSPAKWLELPSHSEIERLKLLILEQPKQLLYDYENGKFKEYQKYKSSTGIILSSIEDAISFNNFHEGLHMGFIIALKKIINN